MYVRLPSFGDRLVVCDCDRLTCCSGGVEVEDWLLADDWVVHTFICEYIALFSKYNLWPFFLFFSNVLNLQHSLKWQSWYIFNLYSLLLPGHQNILTSWFGFLNVTRV